MSLRDFIKRDTIQDTIQEVEIKQVSKKKFNYTDSEYWMMMDPNTGERYDIPMVNPGKPGYSFRYIDMMKERVISPDTFQKIMNWD